MAVSFHVGDVIRKLRQERRWTLTTLAQRAGVNKMTLSAIENGKNHQRDTMQRIAAALGISVGRLETTLHEWAEMEARPSGVIAEADRQLLVLWKQVPEPDQHWHLQAMQRSADVAAQTRATVLEAQRAAARPQTDGAGADGSTPGLPARARSMRRRLGR